MQAATFLFHQESKRSPEIFLSDFHQGLLREMTSCLSTFILPDSSVTELNFIWGVTVLSQKTTFPGFPYSLWLSVRRRVTWVLPGKFSATWLSCTPLLCPLHPPVLPVTDTMAGAQQSPTLSGPPHFLAEHREGMVPAGSHILNPSGVHCFASPLPNLETNKLPALRLVYPGKAIFWQPYSQCCQRPGAKNSMVSKGRKVDAGNNFEFSLFYRYLDVS